MTMTRPCRRMIRHLLQIFFTLGLTFMTVSAQMPVRQHGGPASLVIYLYR